MANKYNKEPALSVTPATEEPSLGTLIKESEAATPEVAKTDPAPTSTEPETFHQRLDRFVVESASTASRYSDSSLEDTVFYVKLIGETGEVCDLLGKFLGHGHPYNRDKLLEECGDVVWYCAAIQRKYGRKSVGLEPFQHIGNLEETLSSLAPYVAGFKPSFMRESGAMEVTERCNRILSLLMGVIREADLSFAGTTPTYTQAEYEAVMVSLLEKNKEKLAKRYPSGFSSDKSLNRTEEKLLVPPSVLRPSGEILGSDQADRSENGFPRDVYAGGRCSFWLPGRRAGHGEFHGKPSYRHVQAVAREDGSTNDHRECEAMINIVNKVKVTYIDHMGSDEAIIAAARQSTDGEFRGWGTPEKPGDEKLLKYMWDHGHLSVFEFAQLHIQVECPMDTRTQIMRHRTFSFSERSGRYCVLPNEMYKPPAWKGQASRNKQGSSEVLGGTTQADNDADNLAAAEFCYATYERMLARGTAKEQARRVLPVGWMTQFRMAGDLRCWLAFLKLRLGHDAQDEAQWVAAPVAEMIKQHFPHIAVVAL